MRTGFEDEENEGENDEDIKELMKNYDLDKNEAEHVREIMDDHGLDESDAVELKDDL